MLSIISGISLFFFLILSGCNLPNGDQVLTATSQAQETLDALPEATEIPADTPTPLPALDKVVFVPGAEAASGISLILSSELPAFCEGRYDYEEKAGMTTNDLPENTKYVVFADIPGNLTAYVSEHPEVRFIIIGSRSDIYDGVWTIQYDAGYLPFLAGMASAMSAYDWRCAGLLPSDSAIYGEHMQETFMNGAHFYCGRCQSTLSPYVAYPLPISLPSATAADAWNNALNEAQKSIVYTVFVSDEAAQSAVFENMKGMNVKLLGFSAPPAGTETQWLASINYDWTATFEDILSRSESGETGGLTAPSLLIIPGDLKEDFYEGKAHTLRETYEGLLSGLISAYNATKEYSEESAK